MNSSSGSSSDSSEYHSHPRGRHLIQCILKASQEPGHTAYDIMRLPMYKTWQEHIDNHDAIQEELHPNDCSCENRAQALTLNNAWAIIGTAPAPQTYNALLLARPVPAIFIPSFLPPPDVYPQDIFMDLNRRWELDIDRVQDGPLTLLWRCDRGETEANDTYRLLFSDKKSTFWTSLAIGLYNDWQFWGHVKCKVAEYYRRVRTDPQHPRNQDYALLNISAVAKGHRPFTAQLRAGTTQNAQTGPVQVSSELWQIVADCFHIELLVISGDTRMGGKNGRSPYLPVVPRGNHNNRQVFLRRLPDDEYFFIRPDKPNPHEFRYTGHIPREKIKLPPKAQGRTAHNIAWRRSNDRRNPYIITDNDGVPVNNQRNYIANYTGTDQPPFHVEDALEPVTFTTLAASPLVIGLTDAQLNPYYNNGLWL
ncbi:hypothetical protein G7Y89_g1823 [Cudoniella acicularis]|uniref:Uncharacterized protein n=1 Tax=Cudoniella acicularis TaxID=354080 RepID=A0A8H4RVL1_9HELO|nr:hypothetical protein G7Y89_g1823 [Cudoniella acicularis]